MREWKYIVRDLNADIICLENEELFDSRKFKTMGDIGKLLEDQFLSSMLHMLPSNNEKGTEGYKRRGSKLREIAA